MLWWQILLCILAVTWSLGLLGLAVLFWIHPLGPKTTLRPAFTFVPEEGEA